MDQFVGERGNPMSYWELLKLAMPETIVVITMLMVLLVDLGVMRQQPIPYRSLMAAAFTCVGCAAAIFWIYNVEMRGDLLNGTFYVSPLTQFVKQVLLLLTIATAVISVETRFTSHIGEYFVMLLLATAGFDVYG